MPAKKIAAAARDIDRDLRVIRQILKKPVEAAVARGGLTGPQQSAMRALVNSNGMSLKQLSQELGLAHSTVSGIIDRLQKQGLVERQSDDADQRSSRIVVTEQVRNFLRRTWPSLELHPLSKALSAATEAERKGIEDGIRTLRRLLENCKE